MGIVRNEFLHRLGAVIGDLQKYRPARDRNAGEGAGDPIIDEAAEIMRACAAASVGIEDFEEMPEALRFGFEAKILVRVQRDVVGVEIVVRRDRIETEICTSHSLVRSRIQLAALNVI